ncbi:MAG: phosphatase PAP2 family protein [bacterium]
MKNIALFLFFIIFSTNLYAQKSAIELSGDILAAGLPVVAGSASLLYENNLNGAFQFTETYAAQLALTYALKFIVNERRPNGGLYSFPSAHTASGFSSAAFIQRRYGWKVGLPAYILAGYTGWTRVYAKKHYIWDVAAGAIIGTGCAYLFTTPYEKNNLQLSFGKENEYYIVNVRFDF